MKYSKLKTLLSEIDKNTSEEDILVNLNDEVALKLRSNYGGLVNNSTCSGNTGCTANSTCKGNNGCSGNSTCNNGCDD